MQRVTVLVLSPDGRTTRRFELTLPSLVLLGCVAGLVLVASLWLGWGVGAWTAAAG